MHSDIASGLSLLLARPQAPDAVFAEPWEARAFALTLALSERGLFTLNDFQAALIGRVGSFEKANCIVDETDYYTRWIEALGDMLAARGLLAEDRLADIEVQVVDDAASRKAHQHGTARDEFGQLKIAPIVVDRAV
ncbi:nitrile hydratase accessory protein [Ancylobacter terrae]|uniref:nitrile hydratase accessory protein n=1 Tax=Ancylobacter sp. sgz301288 TaxID=3342077 RepID=UPI00385F13BD